MATMVGSALDSTGQSIPPDTPYAVSVSLPTWKANVGYEKGEEWVLSKMKTGYPRFYIHECIRQFTQAILKEHDSEQEHALLFPSHRLASGCAEFLQIQQPSLQPHQLRVVHLNLEPEPGGDDATYGREMSVSAVIFPKECAQTAKAFWQHTGEGISSRRADFCHQRYKERLSTSHLPTKPTQRSSRGPKRYQRESSIDGARATLRSQTSQPSNPNGGDAEGQECSLHVEERYGRNLDLSQASAAKIAIRRRIAGLLTANVELRKAMEMPLNLRTTRMRRNFSESDVYLYPTGMSSIFNTHRILMSVRGPMKSICFGFPYIDTLKILQKWGPGCLFYGHGSSDELDDLEKRLESGEQYLALFCEFPSNPLLRSPDLQRIRRLASKFNFAIVVDETVGNLLNVHVLSYADVVVSSLTKIFSGDSNVMGGSAVLNPHGEFYQQLKAAMEVEYQDNYWAEDAIVMERNSRDFASRIQRINVNAEAICEVLRGHDRVKEVYYPKSSPTRQFYDHCRNENGGYGGLLSVTFHTTPEAVTFFDKLETAKGPSLGTNFTLSCPYTLLAHYGELDWAASFGVESDLIRVSVGLEDTRELTQMFERALAAVTMLKTARGEKGLDL